MTDRHVLVVTRDFPPAGGPGVQRVLKFVKYLPEFGWNPVVVTAKPEDYLVRDKSLLSDVPDSLPIYRVPDADVNRLRPGFERWRLGRLITAVNVALLLPDAHFFWSRKARATVLEIMQKYRPEVVFSSSPPASTHMLGLWAARRFEIGWVADFRDPWSENAQTPFLPGYRAANARMEKRVLEQCDHVTTVSPPLVEMLKRLASNRDVTLIENGYDESDVVRHPPPRTKRFTITYTGSFSRLRRPDAFIEAVTGLVAEGHIPATDLRVILAGKNIADYVPDRAPFENSGYLDHSALDDVRRESDLLLLILSEDPGSRGNYSAKVFEYLASNRPILCITNPMNVAAQLISHARAGRVVEPQPDKIAEAVLGYYHDWLKGAFNHDPDWHIIQGFTRRNLTHRLASVFEELVCDG